MQVSQTSEIKETVSIEKNENTTKEVNFTVVLPNSQELGYENDQSVELSNPKKTAEYLETEYVYFDGNNTITEMDKKLDGSFKNLESNPDFQRLVIDHDTQSQKKDGYNKITVQNYNRQASYKGDYPSGETGSIIDSDQNKKFMENDQNTMQILQESQESEIQMLYRFSQDYLSALKNRAVQYVTNENTQENLETLPNHSTVFNEDFKDKLQFDSSGERSAENLKSTISKGNLGFSDKIIESEKTEKKVGFHEETESLDVVKELEDHASLLKIDDLGKKYSQSDRDKIINHKKLMSKQKILTQPYDKNGKLTPRMMKSDMYEDEYKKIKTTNDNLLTSNDQLSRYDDRPNNIFTKNQNEIESQSITYNYKSDSKIFQANPLEQENKNLETASIIDYDNLMIEKELNKEKDIRINLENQDNNLSVSAYKIKYSKKASPRNATKSPRVGIKKIKKRGNLAELGRGLTEQFLYDADKKLSTKVSQNTNPSNNTPMGYGSKTKSNPLSRAAEQLQNTLVLDNPRVKYKIDDLEAFFVQDHSKRTPKACEKYLKLLENFPFFIDSYKRLVKTAQESGSESIERSEFLTNCLKNVKLQKFKRGDLLFNHGDLGDKMYVILSGECKLSMPKTRDEMEEEKVAYDQIKHDIDFATEKGTTYKGTETLRSNTLNKSSHGTVETRHRNTPWDKCLESIRNNQPANAERILEKHKDNEDLRFTLVNIENLPHLVYDDLYTICFGDNFRKYFQEGVFRYKSISTINTGQAFGELALMANDTRSGTIFCTMDSILLSLNKKDFQKIFASSIKNEEEKMQFFEEMFHDWDKNMIVPFAYIFKEKILPRNAVIYREGDKAEYVYIQKEGEVDQYKRIEVVVNKPQDIDFDIPEDKNMEWKMNDKFINTVMKFSVFGENDVMNKKETRSHTAISVSPNTVVYYTEASKFLDSQKFLKQHFEFFEDIVNLKSKFRNDNMEKRMEQEAKRLGAHEEMTINQLEKQNYENRQKLGKANCFIEQDFLDRGTSVKVGLSLLRKRHHYKNIKVNLEPQPDITIDYIAQKNSSQPTDDLPIEKQYYDDALQGMREPAYKGLSQKVKSGKREPEKFGNTRHKNYLKDTSVGNNLKKFSKIVNDLNKRHSPVKPPADKKQQKKYDVIHTNNLYAYDENPDNSADIVINNEDDLKYIYETRNSQDKFICRSLEHPNVKSHSTDQYPSDLHSINEKTEMNDSIRSNIRHEFTEQFIQLNSNSNKYVFSNEAILHSNSSTKDHMSYQNNDAYLSNSHGYLKKGESSDNCRSTTQAQTLKSYGNDKFSDTDVVMTIAAHRKFPTCRPNYTNKLAKTPTHVKYKEYTEFKHKYQDHKHITQLENSNKLLSQTMVSHSNSKTNQIRGIIRSKKMLQRSGQNSIDMVRYLIPPMQYRGVPVFTEKDSVHQDQLLDKNVHSISLNRQKRGSSSNSDFGLSNQLRESPYMYTLAKKRADNKKQDGLHHDMQFNHLVDDDIFLEQIQGKNAISKTSKNLHGLNNIRINNTKINIKTDVAMNKNNFRTTANIKPGINTDMFGITRSGEL